MGILAATGNAVRMQIKSRFQMIAVVAILAMVAAPVDAGDEDAEVANNMISDLSPLLALFGERAYTYKSDPSSLLSLMVCRICTTVHVGGDFLDRLSGVFFGAAWNYHCNCGSNTRWGPYLVEGAHWESS